MVGTCPCLIEAMLRRSGRRPRWAARPCGALRLPRAVGRCCLVRCCCPFVRSSCCCLRRVRSGGARVLLRGPRAVRRCVLLSLRCAVVRAACC